MKHSEVLFKLKQIGHSAKPSDGDREFVSSSVSNEQLARFFFVNAKSNAWKEELINFVSTNRQDSPYAAYPYLFDVLSTDISLIDKIQPQLGRKLDYYGFTQLIQLSDKLPREDNSKLVPILSEYLTQKPPITAKGLGRFLVRLMVPDILNEGVWDLISNAVRFLPDPKREEKVDRRKSHPDDWYTSLTPKPRLDPYSYEEFLNESVSEIATAHPQQVVSILIDAVSDMIDMRFHPNELESGSNDDASEIWCVRLDKPDNLVDGPVAALIGALTNSCEILFEKAPTQIQSLDNQLKGKRWKLFQRLRHHLYAKFPSEVIIKSIHESILSYLDYRNSSYNYEFQKLIKSACQFFGESILTEDERSVIFEYILRGPDHDEFRDWMGSEYTKERWEKRKSVFQRKQLRPFSNVLFGKYKTAYRNLEEHYDDRPLTDDDYSPISETRGGTVSFRSPKSAEEMSQMGDREILDFINDWEKPERPPEDFLVEENIEALSGAFGKFFETSVVVDHDRLNFWFENKNRIVRPVYIRSIVQAMEREIKNGKHDKLHEILTFCNWILDLPITDKIDESYKSAESPEYQDWRSSHRAVGDFVGACFSKDTKVPFEFRSQLADLLRKLCTQFDYWLDRDKQVIEKSRDQITEAINKTRSRALEDLVDFGYWIRRNDSNSDISEVWEILGTRLDGKASIPLKLPERALLGLQFGRIWNLDNDWAKNNKDKIFSKEDPEVWAEVFAAFIRFNLPHRMLFEILKEDYGLALDNISEFKKVQHMGRDDTDILGQHLHTFYIWGIYPLVGPDSLLEMFYNVTSSDIKHWAALFDHVGRSLKNSGKKIEDEIHDRVNEFFDWRLKQGQPEELREFTFWLEAECLDPDWRLDSYLSILSIVPQKDIGVSIQLDALNKLLNSHVGKVIACFAEITASLSEDNNLYIQTEKAKPILLAGFKHENESVRELAEQARENLLRAGRFDFLEIER